MNEEARCNPDDPDDPDYAPDISTNMDEALWKKLSYAAQNAIANNEDSIVAYLGNAANQTFSSTLRLGVDGEPELIIIIAPHQEEAT